MGWHWLTERRRARLLEQPFPEPWLATLQARVAAYALLDADEQHHLRELVTVFVAEKHWEGCGGLELTDEHRVTIAGSGCLLLLGRDHDLFADVVSILVYPSTVLLPERPRSVFDPGIMPLGGPIEADDALLGQAFAAGPVILAWDAVVAGAANAHDGRNVVIHELAHKIDFLDGAANGTPELPNTAARRAWAEACSAAFLALKARVADGDHGFLRDYAATNEAEFFAVATEVLFEQPRALREHLPEVYGVMSEFYGLDLAARGA